MNIKNSTNNKKIKLALINFVFLSSVATFNPVWAMDPEEKEKNLVHMPTKGQNEVEIIKKQLNQLHQIKDAFNTIDNAVLDKIPNGKKELGIALVGLTKGGKSTLLNYLSGIPLYANKRSGPYVISTEDGKDLSPICHVAQSETTLPVIAGDYYDFAGFQAISGAKGLDPLVQDIVNAYSIYKLLNHTKKIKLVLVTPENDILRMASPIQQLVKMFPSTDITRHLCLVVTKRRDTELKDIPSFIAEVFLGVNLTEVQKKIITDFSREDNQRIAAFDYPIKPGLIPDDNTKAIKKAIEKTHSLKGLKPELSLSDAAQNLLNDLVRIVVDEISTTLSSIDAGVPSYCISFIKDKRAGELRTKFENLSHNLDNLPVDFIQSLKKFQTVLQTLSPGVNPAFINLFEHIGLLQRFKSMNLKGLNINENPMWNALSIAIANTHHYLSDLSLEPSSDSIGFTGSIIGLSDLFKKEQCYTSCNIVSKHSFICDANILLPGANITVTAPYWFVAGKKSINLKGFDGEPNHKAANSLGKAADGIDYDSNGRGHNGANGQNGGNGKDGGHFKGSGGKNFYNLDSLSIDVSGGDGGDGQDGGNGADGRPGKDGNKQAVNNRTAPLSSRNLIQNGDPAADNIHARNAKMVFTAGNDLFREVYESSGTAGGAGGDGGTGGQGGRGGKPGIVNIEGIKQNFKADPGAPGNPGKSGDGGKGRTHTVYSRKYIAEYACPGLRGIKTFDSKSAANAGIVAVEGVMGGALGAGGVLVAEGVGLLPAAAGVGSVAPAAAIGLVVVGAVKAVSSPISAYISSHWESDMEQKICKAPDGNTPPQTINRF